MCAHAVLKIYTPVVLLGRCFEDYGTSAGRYYLPNTYAAQTLGKVPQKWSGVCARYADRLASRGTAVEAAPLGCGLPASQTIDGHGGGAC